MKSTFSIAKEYKSVLVFVIALIVIVGFVNGGTIVHAAEIDEPEIKEDYLPEGWTRIETGLLSDEEIQNIMDSISYTDVNDNSRAAAPALSSLDIIDLATDENNEIHVVIEEIGYSRGGSRLTYWNGTLCSENLNETINLVGTDRVVYGFIRFYHTNVYYVPSVYGMSVTVRAQSTSTNYPWNTLYDTEFFTIPTP